MCLTCIPHCKYQTLGDKAIMQLILSLLYRVDICMFALACPVCMRLLGATLSTGTHELMQLNLYSFMLSHGTAWSTDLPTDIIVHNTTIRVLDKLRAIMLNIMPVILQLCHSSLHNSITILITRLVQLVSRLLCFNFTYYSRMQYFYYDQLCLILCS